MAMIAMIIGAAVGALTAAILTPLYYDVLENAGVAPTYYDNGELEAAGMPTLHTIANAVWYMVWIAVFASVAKQIS